MIRLLNMFFFDDSVLHGQGSIKIGVLSYDGYRLWNGPNEAGASHDEILLFGKSDLSLQKKWTLACLN